MPADLGLFVQLVDPADPKRILLETEMAALNGGYQTSLWQPNEVVVDQVDLTVSALPPGRSAVAIGWHNPARPGEPLLAAEDAAGRALGDGRARLPLTVNLP